MATETGLLTKKSNFISVSNVTVQVYIVSKSHTLQVLSTVYSILTILSHALMLYYVLSNVYLPY